MDVEKDLIIAVLKLTKNGLVSHELINKEAKIPVSVAEKLLRKLQNDGLIYFRRNIVEADGMQRLQLAVKAINLGADLENVSSFLQWQEFENIAATALERNSYSVDKNLRFKYAGRKWEIDIIGYKKPIAICIDCKHWHHGMHPSTLKKFAEEQTERTCALAESIQNYPHKIECASWSMVKFVPAVLTLVVGGSRFYDNVPIVPILQLQDFLNKLPAFVDSIKHFAKQF